MDDAISTDGSGNVCDPSAGWTKSSYSMSNGQCVEVGRLPDGRVGMRHSKIPDGPVLRFDPAEWTEFLRKLRDSDLPPLGR
jgi:hypothetical protein